MKRQTDLMLVYFQPQVVTLSLYCIINIISAGLIFPYELASLSQGRRAQRASLYSHFRLFSLETVLLDQLHMVNDEGQPRRAERLKWGHDAR